MRPVSMIFETLLWTNRGNDQHNLIIKVVEKWVKLNFLFIKFIKLIISSIPEITRTDFEAIFLGLYE